MKKKHLLPFLLLLALPLVLSSCDGKNPQGGYISADEVTKIVTKFDTAATYNSYHVEGTLNFFGNPKQENGEDNIRDSVSKDVTFTDSLDKYDKSKAASYYLSVPLHITLTSWNSEEKNNNDIPLSTKYQLEAKMYRVAGLDKVYYYANEMGGLTAKTFAVNKNLIINDGKYQELQARAKWNVEVVYDSHGYLVKESFATLNSNSGNPADYCKGEATYTFGA